MKLAALCLAFGLLSDSVHAESLLDLGYRDMYNLQFDAAHAAFSEYQRENPKDPFGAVSDAAAYLFSEFDRLHVLRSEFALNDENFSSTSKPLPASPVAKQSFESALAKTKGLAEAGLRQSPPDPKAMLATTFRFGLQADYLALIEKRELPALSEIKKAQTLADKLLSTHPSITMPGSPALSKITCLASRPRPSDGFCAPPAPKPTARQVSTSCV